MDCYFSLRSVASNVMMEHKSRRWGLDGHFGGEFIVGIVWFNLSFTRLEARACPFLVPSLLVKKRSLISLFLSGKFVVVSLGEAPE